MNNLKLYTVLLLVLTMGWKAQAQQKDTLLLFAHYTAEGVKIRIAPQLAQTWLKGAELGYDLYRTDLQSKQEVKLNQKPIKPMTKEEASALTQGDSLFALNELAIYANIQKNKAEMSVYERLTFIQGLQDEYALYFLLSSRIPELCKASGLYYLDKTAKENGYYSYKVKIHGDIKASRVGQTNLLAREAKMFIPELSAREGEKQVGLQWEHYSNTNPVLCYYVEKSADGEKYTRLFDAPYYPTAGKEDIKLMKFSDSLEQNYEPHYYRLVGIDMWGEEHTSEVSLKAQGVDRTPIKAPMVRRKTDMKKHSVTFYWNSVKEEDFKGYMLYSSDNYAGPYTALQESLFSDTTSSYTFQNVEPGSYTYFRLLTLDTAGNKEFSPIVQAYLVDDVAPVPPTGFQASIGEKGVVSFVWNKHPEENLKGYRLFAGNRKNGRFIPINQYLIRDTFFVDTLKLNNLFTHKYYYLSAVDLSFNASKRSEIFTLRLPDQVAPAKAFIDSIGIQEQQAHIHWHPSVSTDLQKQVLLQRQAEQVEWKEVKSLEKEAQSFILPIDTGVWFFAVKSLDSSQNTSISEEYVLEIHPSLKGVSLGKPELKKHKESVTLKWKADGEVKQYIVYRLQGKKKAEKMAVVSETTYKDLKLEEGVSYRYRIVAQDKNGHLSESELSNKVRL